MSTGNGKTPEQVIVAQRAVDAAQKQVDAAQRPLKDLDQQILIAQAKVNKANEELAAATQERSAAEEALADGLTGASNSLAKAVATCTEATARTTILQQRLDKLVSQRGPLDAAYQAAATALSAAQTVLDDEMDGAELARCKFHIAQVQEELVAWQKKANTAADRRRDRARRVNDAAQRANQLRMREQFTAVNGPTPGFERSGTTW